MADTLKNGDYKIPVSLKGGTGRAGIESPADVHVKNNETTAEIIWSSSHYDYMVVDGKKYTRANKSGNSRFDIKVGDISKPVKVKADTVAMSTPHLIDYTITFDTSKAERTGGSDLSTAKYVAIPVMIACFVIGLVIGIKASRRRKKVKDKNA
ncbi:MAG: hypothetical protein DUD27_01130 [Lachnospiraceae bacterium]|uniref:NEAT domain-containing protein n=1 Tax=Candidatus Weimeria bifida TaxID=2599074 RepID=A0A6N7IX68_9FIRM|nr:hypothetical protein [Candidatus Weimeria bifida]RRF97193.1 MAG: hypothetical protein DUD27_01130 [Lachnospiraceae bacterium]